MLLRYIKKVITVTLFTMIFVVISAGFAYAEESNTVTVTASILNLREASNTSAKILDQLAKGNQLKVVGSSNGWYKVTENGITGWVSGNYVSNTNSQSSSVQSGTITGNNVNIRKGPGLSYNVITQLNKGEKLVILEVTDSWYKTKTSDGIIGWVSSLYISDSLASVSTDSTENSDPETSRGGDFNTIDIIDYAKSLLGVKYTYGGTTPETGFDCSGFSKYVFEKFGINLERVAADQAKQGTEVSQNELLPGDLIFSDTDGGNNNINHVGIYIGEGNFISAASGSSSGKVIIGSLNSSYWQTAYMTARRIK